jgi:hypothetical protein
VRACNSTRANADWFEVIDLSLLAVDQQRVVGSGASSLVFQGTYGNVEVAVKMLKHSESDQKILREVNCLK